MGGPRLRIPPQVHGIVEDRLTLRIALQAVNQRPGFDAVRVDREEALEAAAAQKPYGLPQAVVVQRRLATVKVEVAVVEVECAPHTVLGVEGLDTLVKPDGP